MSVRIRRLQAEYERLKLIFADFDPIRIVEVSGRPPDRYVIEYHVGGLVEDKDGIHDCDTHRAEIVLGPSYPAEMPRCTMLTPVFHPNIDHIAICTEDIGSPGQTLDQTIVFIAEMIAYQAYNLQSPRNGDAARWTKENQERLPIDNSNFVPSAWLRGTSEIEIAQSAEAAFRTMPASSSEDEDAASPIHSKIVDLLPQDSTSTCANCGRAVASGLLSTCPDGHELCPDCRPRCANCATSLCLLCPTHGCSVCRQLFCDDCNLECGACGQLVCLGDGVACSACKTWICNNHLIDSHCPTCADIASISSAKLS